MIALIREDDGAVLALDGTIEADEALSGQLTRDALEDRSAVTHGYIDTGYRCVVVAEVSAYQLGEPSDPDRIRDTRAWLEEVRGRRLVGLQREDSPLISSLAVVELRVRSVAQTKTERFTITLQDARFASSERLFVVAEPPPPPRPDVADDVEGETDAGRRGASAPAEVSAFQQGFAVARGTL